MKTIKLFLAILLMAYASTAIAAFNPSGGGTGTLADPYKLANLADLGLFQTAINGGTDLTAYVELSANISATGTWAGIGTTTNYFKGSFDGKGFSISNLTNATINATQFGFFNHLSNGTTIKNLNLLAISYTSTTTNSISIGGLIGSITIAGTVTIDNCYVSGTINSTVAAVSTGTATLRAAGLVGQNGPGGGIACILNITNCKSGVSITAASNSTATNGTGRQVSCGGILGDSPSGSSFAIVNCFASGTILASSIGAVYAGGIMANNSVATAKIYNCYSAMTIDALTSNVITTPASIFVGGIAGSWASGSEIKNCIALNTHLQARTANSANTGINVFRIAGGTLSAGLANYGYATMEEKQSLSWTGTISGGSGTTTAVTPTSSATGKDGATTTATTVSTAATEALGYLNGALATYSAYSPKTWSMTSVSNPAFDNSISFATNTYSKTVGDAAFTQLVTATTTKIGAITYASNATGVATVDVSTGLVTIIGAGTARITATQAAGGSYASGTDFYDITVTIVPIVTVTPIGTYTYDGTPQGPNAATNNGTGSTYTFSYVGVSGTTYTASATRPSAAGSYTVTATVAANGNYASASSTATAFSIDVATPTVTPTVGTYTYNGLVQGPIAATNTGTGSSYTFSYVGVSGTTYTASATRPIAAGSYTVTATVAANGNYASASSSATAFTIDKAPQTITFGALAGKTAGDADFSPGASSATNTVTYTSSNIKVATIVSGQIHIVGGGTTSITASQPESANYNAAENVSQSLTVASTLVTLSGITTASDLTNPAADVTIAGTMTVGAPKTLSNLTVASSGIVTVSQPLTITSDVVIAPNASIDLTNTLSISGDLTLKADQTSTFSVKVGSPMTITGTVKFLKTMDDTKWYFMAFPCDVALSGILVNSSPLDLGTNLFIKYYSGSHRASSGIGANWIPVTDDHLTANQGYIFGLTNGAGHNVSEITFPLDRDILKSEAAPRSVAVNYYGALSNVANNLGWNLVGQPFLSKYASQGGDVLNLYRFNGTTYDFYAKNTSNLPEVNPFEAYFTQVSAGLESSGLTFGLNERRLAHSSVAATQSDLVQLNFNTATGTDKTYLIMDDLQSTSYQIGEDLEKLITTGTTIPQVYTVLGGINYANNALPVYTVQSLPIGIYTKTAGSTTISVDASKATSLSKLLLTDNGVSPATVTDLLTSNYSFTADAGTNTSRFAITAQRIATDNNVFNNEIGETQFMITPIAFGAKLIINNLASNATVRVYDALGRMVVSKNTSSNVLEIKLNAKGIYTVQLQSGSTISTRKVIF
ncbi:MAG: T9SS type A sorting domain-containing protein [Paludibacter sp.]